MKNARESEKRFYPGLILAVVLVCTALILVQLWSNISPLLPASLTGWSEELATGVEALIEQAEAFFEGLGGEALPAGSTCLPQNPAGPLQSIQNTGRAHA